MSESFLGDKAKRLLERLTAVDLSRVVIKRRVIKRALEDYFRALELPWRPIRWASDAQSGFEIARASSSFPDDFSPALIPKRPVRVLTLNDWRTLIALRAARVATHSEIWETIGMLVSGEPEGDITKPDFANPLDEKKRRDLRRRLIVWREAIDVTTKIPRVIAAHACFYAGDCTPEADEHYLETWEAFIEAYVAGLWLFWITEEETVVVPRPVVHLNHSAERFRLHSVTGPAVYYPGGERHYFIHGVRVDAEIVETPADELDPRIILRERNADVRREIVRKIGIERVCQALNAQCVDRWGEYELLLLDLQDRRLRPYLKMKNPSLGVWHIEGVAPHCRTVAEALAWRNQTDVPPTVLT